MKLKHSKEKICTAHTWYNMTNMQLVKSNKYFVTVDLCHLFTMQF